MSHSIFENLPNAKSIFALSREELAGYLLEHLHFVGGNPLKQQFSHPNNLAAYIAGRYPNYSRDKIYKNIFSTCKWLINEGYLLETNDQGFFEISQLGSVVKVSSDIHPAADVVPDEISQNKDSSTAQAPRDLGQRPKVFISYSWKDKMTAARLAETLRSSGQVEVWFDEVGIRAGDNLPDEISNALNWCDTLLLIWSTASTSSYWVKLEWTTALALEKKIIPCLLDKTKLPPILAHRVYVDISNFASGSAYLLRAFMHNEQPRYLSTPSPDHREAQTLNNRIATEHTRIEKHPPGLRILCLAVAGERFCYYGVRSILILYMTNPLVEHGLGLDNQHAGQVYIIYLFIISFFPLGGGLIGDLILGSRHTVILGGLLILCGVFLILLNSLVLFYLGLMLTAVGHALIRPNLLAMLGKLYSPRDRHRDSAFSIFYMSVTAGALISPVVCGYLAMGSGARSLFDSVGFNSWSLAIGVAAVGMILALLTVILRMNHLSLIDRSTNWSVEVSQSEPSQLPTRFWRRLVPILALFLIMITYWWALEQGGGLLYTAEDSLNPNDTAGFRFPEPLGRRWNSNLISIFIIIVAPVLAFVWIRLRTRQPSSWQKITIGLICTSGAYLYLIPALILSGIGKISQGWLIGIYILQVVGELCVVPVSMSLITKLAPARFMSSFVALWFLTVAVGSYLASRVGFEFFKADQPWASVNLYGVVALVLLLVSSILAVTTPRLGRLQ